MHHVALLRAVNLPGRNRVRMADLREMLDGLGLGNARSLQASGNLVFTSEDHTPTDLEALLEETARERLGLETDIFVRTAGEWRGLIEANPFLETRLTGRNWNTVRKLEEMMREAE